MKRQRIHPKLKLCSLQPALGLGLGLGLVVAVCGELPCMSSIIPGGSTGGSHDSVLVCPGGSASGWAEVGTLFKTDSPADVLTSLSGECPVCATVGDASDDGSAIVFPLAAAPAPASPELLVAGTLGLMLVGWWKTRGLKL
jgi:hypothetical protein